MKQKTGVQEIPKGLKVYTYYNDVYRADIRLDLGTASAVNKWAKDNWDVDLVQQDQQPCGQTTKITQQQGTVVYVIWCPQLNTDQLQDLGTLIHQCLHVAIYIMGHVGICFNRDDNCQALVYLHECILKQFIKQLKES